MTFTFKISRMLFDFFQSFFLYYQIHFILLLINVVKMFEIIYLKMKGTAIFYRMAHFFAAKTSNL